MFETSVSLLFTYLALYTLIPLLPGILTTWLLAGTNVGGLRFYIISWFLGLGVVSYGLFLTQFIYFGVDRVSYLMVVGLLVVLLVPILLIKKIGYKKLLGTLAISRLHFHIPKNKSHWYKASIIAMVLLILGVIISSFLYTVNFPNYGDDAFGNWHLPVMNIIYDGGVKMFGATEEILGRGRLGYPIMIPLFKVLISNIAGGFNDIYTNILQWMASFLFLLHTILFVYQKTKNIRSALFGACLIVSMPLYFLHSVEGYMDLLSAIYTGLAVAFLYEWLTPEGDDSNFFMALTLVGILSYIKNDGFIVYMSSIFIALCIYFILFYKKTSAKLRILGSWQKWLLIILIFSYFILPFTALKFYYNLGFNQAAGASSGVGLSSTIHTEIFPAIWSTIWRLNNYSHAPILILLIIIYMLLSRKRISLLSRFPVIQFIVLISIFIAVFLFTDNYKFVLDQTTVNRVFTMAIIVFFSSFGLLFDEE